MQMRNDTIAAIATPPGKGGIAIVRMSGPDAVTIADSIFSGRERPAATDRTMLYGHIMDGDERIDEVMVCAMKAPRSYTREDVVEIQCHAGGAAARAILSLVTRYGARLAEPGEFTRRAFLNGRIDLVQAESVMEVIEARGREHLRQAERLMDGSFSRRIESLIEHLGEVSTLLEMNIEFIHQGHEPGEAKELADAIKSIIAEIDGMLSTYSAGSRIRNGVTVVLAGPVNAGKSSLFNTMLGRKRAIVNTRPGTTRDWIEERIVIDGIEINLIDTAGIRSTRDEIEHEGVSESARLIGQADIVVSLEDETTPEKDTKNQKGKQGTNNVIAITSKADLLQDRDRKKGLNVSTVTGEGIEKLKQTISDRASELIHDRTDSDCIVMIERHRELLVSAQQSLKRALESIQKWSEEITTFELQEAHRRFEEILGVSIDLGILDSLFSRFCIGK